MLCDGPGNRIDVIQNVVIRKPHYRPSVSFQVALSPTIVLNSIVMTGAVNLDDDALLATGEIGKEWSDRMLATKLKPAQFPCSQCAP